MFVIGLGLVQLLIFAGWFSLFFVIGKDQKSPWSLQSLWLLTPLLSVPVIMYFAINFQAKKLLPMEQLSNWPDSPPAQWVGAAVWFAIFLMVVNVFVLKGLRRFAIAAGLFNLYIIWVMAGAARFVIAGAWI